VKQTAPSVPLGIRRFEIERVAPAGKAVVTDAVAMEEPLEIRLAYTNAPGERAEQSISVTMRTPGNDEALAAGFLYTEGIVSGPADISFVGPCGPPSASGLINVVRVELAPEVDVDLQRLERHFYTSSSCGVCGKSSLDAIAVQGRYDIETFEFVCTTERLGGLPLALRAQQAAFDATGGLHASGLFDEHGEISFIREDVGRHNALDKLIGTALMDGRLPLSRSGVIVSGRASFELLQKAMMAGVPMLAAVGAPSSLAIELAQEFGITLIGFLKPDQFNVYARPDRVA
jgi:FdhD protein